MAKERAKFTRGQRQRVVEWVGTLNLSVGAALPEPPRPFPGHAVVGCRVPRPAAG
jgi:hypothetical protein